MNKTIDLQQFCVAQNDERENLRLPFLVGKWTVACNGHIMIALDQVLPYKPVWESAESMMQQHLAMVEALDKTEGWTPVDQIGIYYKECAKCDGSGRTTEDDCPACDGYGTFRHYSHRYECQECGGDGIVYVACEKDKGAVCKACDGIARYIEGGSTFDAGEAQTIQGIYVAMLRTLPNARVQSIPEQDMTAIRFDGGIGVVMNYRTRPISRSESDLAEVPHV